MKTKRKINAIKWNNNQGFTLVEIMVATAISLLIITSVYSAFRSSLSAYERNQTKVIMLQKVRISLDRMARDFSNLYYDADDEELTFLSEDAFDSELNVDQDMISFVAVVNPKLNDYLQKQQSNQSTDEEESENALPSDLARVIYFIGQDPDNQDMQSLMRIEMTELSTEELETLLDEIQSTSPTEEIKDMLRRSTLVDNIGGFNIRYFDGEDWVDKWDIDEEENIPKAVELTLTVADPDNKQKPITQAVVVYLPFSENKTEQG
ncbi:TPA: prepilin-type N-terminal cleavage/methylation domain-containing protein, partial [bacterium]|nr:prepilin-type N-terminal cleavage/methylation domain-containing protein [bacterium]